MHPPSEREKSVESLLAEQIAYYDAQAAEYDSDETPARAQRRRDLVDDFRLQGDVLEFAGGTGLWTQELLRHARSVTVVDTSPQMLAINQARVGDDRIRRINADIFAWQPDRVYDVVFFAFWLSHVPPERFEAFWKVVARCVNDQSRVVFVDEDDRSALDERLRIGETPSARRVLRDGREFDIVKVFWRVEDLQERLSALGWNIGVRRVGEIFLAGSGVRRGG